MSEEKTPSIPPAPFAELDTTNSSVDESIPSFEPAVDIGEDQYEYLFVVEAPGVPVDDFEVTATAGALEVSATSKLRASEQSKRYVRVERELGDFHRAFELPDDADVENLCFDLLDGILHIHLPKVRPSGSVPRSEPDLVAGNEKQLPQLEPDLAIDRPNLVRTIISEQNNAIV